MISLSVNKENSNEKEIDQKLHGIFTYYFCKIIGEKPNITPVHLVERMEQSIERFDEIFICEIIKNYNG